MAPIRKVPKHELSRISPENHPDRLWQGFLPELALILVITAVAAIGWLMLYSIAGGAIGTWAKPQMQRFGLGMALMFFVAFVPIWFWRNMSGMAYAVGMILLLIVEFFGVVGMGAQRWIDIGFMRLQPSELMKVTLVMMLATYYDWLDDKKVSRPL